jgi:hypothetical protein
MSEKTPLKPETSIEAGSETQSSGLETARETSGVEKSKAGKAEIDHLRDEIATEVTGPKLEVDKNESDQSRSEDAFTPPPSKDLRKETLKKELTHVRKNLSKPDRLGSKVIHQPLIRSISEASSKTLTRPSGLLGGGLVAFIGSGLYYYLSKHMGFTYNYLLFVLFFVAGFIVGLILELGLYSIKSKKTVKE